MMRRLAAALFMAMLPLLLAPLAALPAAAPPAISWINLPLQAKLLRILQEKEFSRLGSHSAIKIDVRIIAATNKDLESMIRDGQFREDLYYRINVVHIYLPPLRERQEDISQLVEHFFDAFRKECHAKMELISKEAMEAIIKVSLARKCKRTEEYLGENRCTLRQRDYSFP